MSNFNTTLQRLLNHLRALPSSLHPASASLQRAAIRLSRAFTALREPQTGTGGVELLVRLRGRLQELEEAVVEAELAGVQLSNDGVSWSKLRGAAVPAREELERVVKDATNAAVRAATGNGGHSRTPSAELPRRVPPTSASNKTTRAELDAFLSRSAARSSFGPASTDAAAAARARQLNEAFTLFLLSTSPSSVLPPGQTLSSVFQQTRHVPSPSLLPVGQPDSLESRIFTQLHQAYFDSFASVFSPASSSSSSSGSSAAIEEAKHAAWARLTADLSSAAVPLIPSRMRTSDPSGLRNAREELEARLSTPCIVDDATQPSSGTGEFNPRKALEAVKATVDLLQKLCAPARDVDVRSLLSDLSSALSPSASSAEVAANLAPLVWRVLTLTSDMASDVQRFKRDMAAHWASEGDLRQVVKEEAGERERKVVVEWVGGKKEVRKATEAWVRRKVDGVGSGGEGEVKKEDVAAALVETLFSDSAIALPSLSSSAPYLSNAASTPATSTDGPPPTSTSPPNLLPPPLLVPSPFLFFLQNRLQALAILTCLVTLAGLPPPAVDPKQAEEEQDKFVRRVWTILEAEIPSPSSFVTAPAASAREDEGTKIAHLADEVLSYRRALSALSTSSSSSTPIPLSENETARLRSSVDRILRAEDPVYKLLKARLKEGVRAGVVAAVSSSPSAAVPTTTTTSGVPAQLQTGRRAPGTASSSASRPAQPSSAPSPSSLTLTLSLSPIKGFDRPPFLREKVLETVQAGLFGSSSQHEGGGGGSGGGVVWRWMEEVWGGVLGWREEAGAGRGSS